MRRSILYVGVVVLCAFAAFGAWQFTRPVPPTELSLEEADKRGAPETYQLLVRINRPEGEGDGFERGDIILIAPETKQWSLAEREGFLILKMRLTETQKMILLQPKERKRNFILTLWSDERPEQEKNRRYTVDFGAVGVGPDDNQGRVITDTVFDLTPIKEKE
jgi:hypothetical protein